MVTQGGAGGETKGLTLGWDPTLALVLAIVITTAIGLIFGARRLAQLRHLLPDADADLRGDRELLLRPGDEVRRLLADRRHQPLHARVRSATSSATRTSSTTSRFGVALAVYGAIRYLVRTPFGLSLQGVRDEPVRMSSLGYNVPLHRALAFGFAAFIAALAGVLSSGGTGRSRRATSAWPRRSSCS